jgi:hypothetical protein
VHIDSVSVSLVLGRGVLPAVLAEGAQGDGWRAGPGQAFVEIVLEFVDGQVKDVFHGDRRVLGPLALTVFVWVLPDERDGSAAGRSVAAGSRKSSVSATSAPCRRLTST